MFKKYIYISRIIFTIAFLFVVFKFINYKEVINIYINSKKIYVFFAFFIFLLANILASIRWKYLLSKLGIFISFKEAVYSSFSGYFFNLFFPSFIAGDFFRALSVSLRYGEKNKIASSVLIDRFSGFLGITISALFFSIFILKIINIEIFISIFILNLVVILFLVFSNRKVFGFFLILVPKKFKYRLYNFYNEICFFKNKPSVFFISIFFSIFIQVLISLSFFLSSLGVGVNIKPIYFFIIVPIIMFISLIPITVFGMGTRELSAIYFFSLIGISKPVAVAISIFHFIFGILLALCGALIYIFIYNRWLLVKAKKC